MNRYKWLAEFVFGLLGLVFVYSLGVLLMAAAVFAVLATTAQMSAPSATAIERPQSGAASSSICDWSLQRDGDADAWYGDRW